VKRRALLAAAAALPLALGACPLPQPLAEVARTADGGSVSTPIILPETAVPAGGVVLVSPTCATAPVFSVGATVEDLDTDESVQARWFVDYPTSSGIFQFSDVPAAADSNDPNRPIPPFGFSPYTFGAPPAAALHVVEVVISNGFLQLGDPTPPLNRAAAPPFVTQVYRWVFQYDAQGRCQ
jgi:hypothetical protein